MRRVPATVITGFLGAGKTSLDRAVIRSVLAPMGV
jgi:G3E family GTPase